MLWAHKKSRININKWKENFKRSLLLLVSASLVVSVVGTTIFGPGTYADTTTAKPTDLDNQITTTLYRNALAVCMEAAPLPDGGAFGLGLNAINQTNVLKYQWFTTGNPSSLDVLAGPILNSAYGSSSVKNAGDASCGDPAFIQEALGALGYTVPAVGSVDQIESLLCSFGFSQQGGGCGKTGNAFQRTTSGAATYQTFMKATNSKVKALTPAAKYVLALGTFTNVCDPTQTSTVPTDAVNSSIGIPIKVLSGSDAGSFKMVDNFFDYGSSTHNNWSAATGVGEGYSMGIIDSSNIYPISLNVASLGVEAIGNALGAKTGVLEFAGGFVNIDGGLRGNPVAMGAPVIFSSGTGIGIQSACGALGNLANQYANDYLTWAIINPTQALQLQQTTQKPKSATPVASTCTIEGIGWIVCPVVNFLAQISDAAFGFLADNFLNTSTQIVSPTGTTHSAWVVMRNIANVAFVIAFLIIIFSQLTGLGVTNYGVKKMLPRIVVAAILVNVSFYVCAVAVDLSNILGYSLKGLLNGVGATVSGAGLNSANYSAGVWSGGNSFTSIAGGVLGFAVVGYAGYALIGTLVPVLIAAALALLMILFLLIAREALIVLLIVISPLAFVAYLLPNTESWFKKWRQALVAMLMLFPIISLVYGVSSLASAVLSSTFTASTISGDTKGFFGQIIGAAVLVLPLFAVPVLLKKSLDGIPAVGKFASGIANKATGNLSGKAKESYANSLAGRGAAIRKQARQNFRDKRFAGRLSQGKTSGLNNFVAGGVPGALSRIPGVGKLSGKFKPAGILGAQREALGRAAQGTAATAQSDELKQEMTRLQGQFANDRGALAKHLMTNYANMNGTEVQATSDLLLGAGGVDEYRSILKEPGITSRHMGDLVASGRRNGDKIREQAGDLAQVVGDANAVQNYGQSGYDASTNSSTLRKAYGTAEAGKLLTMSEGTAKLLNDAGNIINKDQAKLAMKSPQFGNAKTGTQAAIANAAR